MVNIQVGALVILPVLHRELAVPFDMPDVHIDIACVLRGTTD